MCVTLVEKRTIVRFENRNRVNEVSEYYSDVAFTPKKKWRHYKGNGLIFNFENLYTRKYR